MKRVTYGSIFSGIPAEIRNGSIQDARAWKELYQRYAAASKIRGLTTQETLERLEREANGLIARIRERKREHED